MKAGGKRLLSCMGVLCLLVVLLAGLSSLLQNKLSKAKNAAFLQQEENFDVLFLGTSHVINGIFPMELWEHYGIVSYNLGAHGAPLPTDYWILQNALEHTSPRLVVVDCYNVRLDLKAPTRYEYLHRSFDAFPLGLTKARAVMDLLEDPTRPPEEANTARTKRWAALEYLWDFALYHSRWSELQRGDFIQPDGLHKGAEIRMGYSAPGPMISLPQEEKLQGDTVGIQYLRKIIESCQARGIEVLLTYLPFPATAENWQEANRIYDIAAEYDIHYLNLLDGEVVDADIDFFDGVSHLNPSGARKVSEYLGQYIAQTYGVPDHRQDAAYAAWQQDAVAYATYKNALLRGQQEMALYFLLLADKDNDFFMLIGDPSFLAQAPFAAWGRTVGLTQAQLSGAGPWLAVCSDGQLQEIWQAAPGAGPFATCLGEVRLENGVLCCDEAQLLPALAEGASAGLRVAVLAKGSRTLVDAVNFDLATQTAFR